ncbi:MAG: MFS transporter, partial [Cytophagaceae bacterium]|nr:MFS transporter [Gemmatimonadaceae bacterium]
VAARLFGTVTAVVLGGLTAIVTVAVTAWRVPVLRHLGEIRRPE